MKTPLQKLKIWIDESIENETLPFQCSKVIDEIDKLIAEERSAIIDAVKYGFSDAQCTDPDNNFSDYYNLVYNEGNKEDDEKDNPHNTFPIPV